MSARIVLGALLSVSALATAAAGQQPVKGAPKTPPRVRVAVVKRGNPCSVLLPDEVEQVLGTPITGREIMDEVTCHFDYDKPQRGVPPYFEVKVYFQGGRTEITSTRLASRLLGGKTSGFEQLSGIGDEAWLAPYASLLLLRKGDAGVEMDLRLIRDARPKGIRLAQLVAQHLAAAGF